MVSLPPDDVDAWAIAAAAFAGRVADFAIGRFNSQRHAAAIALFTSAPCERASPGLWVSEVCEQASRESRHQG